MVKMIKDPNRFLGVDYFFDGEEGFDDYEMPTKVGDPCPYCQIPVIDANPKKTDLHRMMRQGNSWYDPSKETKYNTWKQRGKKLEYNPIVIKMKCKGCKCDFKHQIWDDNMHRQMKAEMAQWDKYASTNDYHGGTNA